MPTLRFSRDRRGYESTYLLHASRRRPGSEQAQLLYWFRSPPHVKIGRAAFDEDAIRLLEEQHPDVEFDWDRILTTKPPAAPEVRDPRDSRAGRRPERRPAKESRRDAPRAWQPAAQAEMSAETEQVAPDVTGPPTVEADTPAADIEVAPALQDAPTPGALPPVDLPVPEPPSRRFVRVFDAPAPAAVPAEHHASEPSAVERLLGAEQLTVLRARHAEILARISVRGGDPARLEALREQASAVDPDGWVTEADVTAGLASIDGTLAELHRIVGRRRRRRRRRRGEAGPVQPAGATTGDATGESLELAADEEPEAEDGADGPDDE